MPVAEKIAKFQGRAPAIRSPDVDFSTGRPEVFALLAQSTAALATKVGALADRAAAREGEEEGIAAGLAASVPSAVPFLPAQSPAGPKPSSPAGGALAARAGPPSSDLLAAGLLAELEGFRETAYFDVNAYRTGFGSDTVTRPDGSVEKVTASTRIDRADAERDLTRRVREFQMTAIGQVGADAWKALDAPTQAALTSIAYNYGSLPARLIPAVASGDKAAIAAGIEALGTDNDGVNAERRRREAALVRSGPAVAATQLASPPLHLLEPPAPAGGAALALRRDGTIRGEAHDRAALNIYLDRLDTSTRTAMWAYGEQHRDDPAGLASALDAYAAGVKGTLEPRAVPLFEGVFQRERLSLLRQAADGHQRQLEQTEQAVFEESLAMRRTALVRLAAKAGNDETANLALAAEMEDMTRFVGAHSTVSPTKRGEILRALRQDVATARLMGAFDKAVTPEARAALAAGFQAAWENGDAELAGVEPETYERITSAMESRLAKDVTARATEARKLERGIDSLMGRVKDGYDVPEEERQALKAAVEATGAPELAEEFHFFERLADWQKRSRTARPETIAAQADAMEAEVRETGATPRAVAALDMMRGLQGAIEKGLKDDPLAWAEHAGRLKVTPLDTSSPESFRATLAARAAEADAVADFYGRPKRFFKAAEVAAINLAAAENPAFLVEFARDLPAALGKDTPKALAEISKDAPIIAHAAGLALSTRSDAMLQETAQALGLRKIEGYEAVAMKPAEKRAAVAGALGNALIQTPALEAAAVAHADLLFELRARAAGLDPAADAEGAADLYRATLNDVLGARIVDGRQHGGLVEVNDAPTIAPADMPAEELQNLISSLDDRVLAQLPPIFSANGVPIEASRLAQARLLAVGDGRYHLAFGDPASGNAQMVMAPGGGPWVLDVRLLRAALKGR